MFSRKDVMAYHYRGGRAAEAGAAAGTDPGPGGRTQVAGVPEESDGQARDRILRSALRLFGEHGFSTTLKQIAADAEVSAPLVLHHFGSKAGLRAACDAEVAVTFRRLKTESVRRGTELSLTHALIQFHQSRPLLRYLVHAIRDGGTQIDELLDQLIDDALVYTADAEARGLVRPSTHPRRRAAVLLLMSFGALTMHDQLRRLIGVSPVDDPPETWGPYVAAVSEIFLDGVLIPEAYPELVALVDHHRTADEESHP